MTSTKAQLRVLGPVRLHGATAEASDLMMSGPKKLAFLTYVAMQADGVSRDRLCAVFWPESDETRARSSLRQYLSQIRSAMGAELFESEGAAIVRVDPERLGTDAAEFQRLLEAGAEEEALSLYRGPFLDGFLPPRLSGFDEWAEGIRLRFETQAADVAWSLATRAEARGHLGQAAFWGKRSLGLSPFEESRARRLMSLLDRVGDRAGALRVFRGLEEWLEAEFDATPSPETRKVRDDIRAREEEFAAARGSFGDRRRGGDRRNGDRRVESRAHPGPERRSGQDRRQGGGRRSGQDRRRILG